MTTAPFVISDDELNGLIARYTRDFTAQDREGKFDPISGRDSELQNLVLILLQRLRKNVMLLGPAGVGKTALFVGLSQLINAGKVPKQLQNARVIELEMSMIGAGSSTRADLEGRLIPIVKGVAERNASGLFPPIIFCIDEIHQLMISFKASSYSGIADLLKPYLTNGDLYVVGATTAEEYDDYVKQEPAIDRRFQKVNLDVPDLAMTASILRYLRPNFEKHYGFKITDETIERLVKLTDRYIRNRNNPDKSIIMMDQACAHATMRGITDELDNDSIAAAIGAETGINKLAVG
ncbi:MAG TPA: ATP-dependent Clp protease ATP-binding subunit [Rhodospirillaceae bacterium]|nr:ATP-dependent Clp protease ATP-binding subunit [Rhodospirillaceae bacterium]